MHKGLLPEQPPFLADENIQPSVIQFLRSLDVDIISTLSEDLIGHSDDEIAAKAYAARRVVLTQDQDSGKLFHTTDTKFIGIVYLRPGHIAPAIHIETLNRMLEVSTELIQPFIVVGANLNGKITIRIRNQVF